MTKIGTIGYRASGPMNTDTYDADVAAWQRRTLAALTRPTDAPSDWSAYVALATAVVERAEVIYATASAEHLPAVVDDGAAVDGVCMVADYLYRAALGDPNALDDETWSCLPGWWQTKIVQSWREQTGDDHAWSRVTEALEHTAAVPRSKDGMIRRSRRRANMAVMGAADRTVDGAPLTPEMAAYGVIARGTEQTAGTAQAAYEALRLMADRGLIPRMLGTDDQMRPELTPELYGAEIEHTSEGPRGIYWPRVRRVIRRGDHAFTIVERVSVPRRREQTFHAFTYGPTVLRSDRDATSARRATHSGDSAAVVVDGIRVRVTHVRRVRGRDAKVSRTIDYGKPRGERWTTNRAHAKRAAATDKRAGIVAALKSLAAQDEGASAAIAGWNVTLTKRASAAGKRGTSLMLIGPTGEEHRVTPRRAATLIATSA